MNTASIAAAIFRQAVAAVQPQHLIPQQIKVQTDGLWIAGRSFHLHKDSRIFVTGAGKASAAMAQALEACNIPFPIQGLVITKYEHALP
jgi:glycerate 2-kinase